MADDMEHAPQDVEGVDWSRRQFIVGTAGLAIVGAGVLFGRSAIAQTIQSLSGTPISQGLTHVYQGDFYFLPNKMTWRVGDQLSILLHNMSPNRHHEWMMGRGFDSYPTQFGDVHMQFHEDFWDGVDVTISDAYDVDNFATNNAKVKCLVDPHPWLVTTPGAGNFSPTLMPGGYIRLDFTVPNKPGEWHYGCFVQGYIHYVAGMKGTLNIVPA